MPQPPESAPASAAMASAATPAAMASAAHLLPWHLPPAAELRVLRSVSWAIKAKSRLDYSNLLFASLQPAGMIAAMAAAPDCLRGIYVSCPGITRRRSPARGAAYHLIRREAGLRPLRHHGCRSGSAASQSGCSHGHGSGSWWSGQDGFPP